MSGKRNESDLRKRGGVWIVLFSKVTPFEGSINKTKFTSIDAQAG